MLTKSAMGNTPDGAAVAVPRANFDATGLMAARAANIAEFDREEVQARRLRRQRRAERAEQRKVGGWTVSIW